MNKKYLTGGLAALLITTAAVGISGTALAANKGMRNSFARSNQIARPKLTADQIATMKAKDAAVKAALEAGDYKAWVTAVTAQNPNSPLLTKITADNFSQLVQVHNLQTQADSIMKNLGIQKEGLGEFNPDFGMMRGGGDHMGFER